MARGGDSRASPSGRLVTPKVRGSIVSGLSACVVVQDYTKKAERPDCGVFLLCGSLIAPWLCRLASGPIDLNLLNPPSYNRKIVTDLMFHIKFVGYHLVFTRYVGFLCAVFWLFPFVFADFCPFFP